jgi:putative FmdB family regulatory protein
MPLYEYVCDRSHTTTLVQPFSADKHVKCPACVDNSAYRVISAPNRAVITKGCSGAQKH